MGSSGEKLSSVAVTRETRARVDSRRRHATTDWKASRFRKRAAARASWRVPRQPTCRPQKAATAEPWPLILLSTPLSLPVVSGHSFAPPLLVATRIFACRCDNPIDHWLVPPEAQAGRRKTPQGVAGSTTERGLSYAHQPNAHSWLLTVVCSVAEVVREKRLDVARVPQERRKLVGYSDLTAI